MVLSPVPSRRLFEERGPPPRKLLVSLVLALALLAGALSATPADSQGDGCPEGFVKKTGTVIWGTPASDRICGDEGANIIIGGLLDDEIYGGGGNDILIGGHGTDSLFGQSGDDLLRGGDNSDVNAGGPGVDTASFADVTPLGDSKGIYVNVPAGSAEIGDWTFDGQINGFKDPLNEIENVIGSAFDDEINAPASGAVTLWGGAGEDVLRGTSSNDALAGEQGVDQCSASSELALTACAGPQTKRAGAAVYGELRKRDRGIVIFGSGGNDSISVTRNAEQVQVSASGAPATDGANCTGSGPVNCTLRADDATRYIVVWGDEGNDTIGFGSSFELGPYENRGGINGGTVDAHGSNGSDSLTGGPEDELLFSGETGNDTLVGAGGADALVSEGSGADQVYAGLGDDQIVADNACAGHHLRPDGGYDVVGFARQRNVAGPVLAGVHAQLADTGGTQQAWAIRPDNSIAETAPGQCAKSTIYPNGEVLEGTEQHDVLIGNATDNVLWGRDAGDNVSGRGGADYVFGHGGEDFVTGDNGADWLYGGDGPDHLDAIDQPELKDHEINCGGGPNDGDFYAKRDKSVDPRPISCEDPTQSFLTLDRVLNGQPGYVSVSGHVLDGVGNPVEGGYVNVNFQRNVNGTWVTESSAHPVLVNGHYDVDDWTVGVGEWRVRAVFPIGQNSYVESKSEYSYFTMRSGYRFIARHSNKCMSLSANEVANGTAILQWDCSPSPNPADGQVFTRVPMGNGEYQLKINSTGKCVDVAWASTANGAYLQQYDCLGPNQANQLWRVIPIAGQPPYVAFQAKHSNLCADVLGQGTGNGVRVGQWECWWGGNQQWTMEAVN